MTGCLNHEGTAAHYKNTQRATGNSFPDMTIYSQAQGNKRFPVHPPAKNIGDEQGQYKKNQRNDCCIVSP